MVFLEPVDYFWNTLDSNMWLGLFQPGRLAVTVIECTVQSELVLFFIVTVQYYNLCSQLCAAILLFEVW